MVNSFKNENDIKFENVYLHYKYLYQPKCICLGKPLKPMRIIQIIKFTASENIRHPSVAKTSSIFIFDDVTCHNHNIIRQYFRTGQQNQIDSFTDVKLMQNFQTI